MKILGLVPLSSLSACLLLTGCPADEGDELGDETSSATETSTGDGDGDPSTGDGDGDPATGDGDGEPATGDGDGEPNVNGSPCSDLVAGLNSGFVIDGTPRDFYIDLPSGADEGGPWPIVFNWHGLGDTAANFRQLVQGYVDGPEFPFIGVTPEDTDFAVMVPIVGTFPLDWDVFDVDDGNLDDNLEIALFDRVLACVDERWGVDPNHIHSMGFSLGGITTDLLATTRGEQLASVGTWSGGYWSNPQNIDPLLGMIVSWPPYVVQNEYPQLIFHGGETDTFEVVPAVYSLSFFTFATEDTTFLNERGHDLVVCDHGGGHTVPGDAGPTHMFAFFADHPLGSGTSWASEGLPDSLPGYCVASPAP